MDEKDKEKEGASGAGGNNIDRARSPVDINSILLPKKEGPSPDSAQRVNAGALLVQEQSATLKSAQKLPGQNGLVEAEPTRGPFGKEVSAGTPAISKREEFTVKAVQTFRSDIERVVQERGVSVVSIAAAEAERRGTAGSQASAAAKAEQEEKGYTLGTKIAMVAGGTLLLGAAAFLAVAVITWPRTTPIAKAPQAPFIAVDETRLIEEPWGLLRRDTLMTDLEAARQSTELPLGLLSWLYVAHPATSTSGDPQFIPAATILETISPNVPQELLRTLNPLYMLGVHSFDENQAFLLLRVDSYDVAYAAMLEWELSMKEELSPLFVRTPRPRIPEDGAATTTASTTPQLLRTVFVDRIVENRDTRVVENEFGDILLLWTFLDRNTVVVTTNEYTLREVVSRQYTAPVTPIPGQ